jgi:hypothetical protein
VGFVVGLSSTIELPGEVPTCTSSNDDRAIVDGLAKSGEDFLARSWSRHSEIFEKIWISELFGIHFRF